MACKDAILNSSSLLQSLDFAKTNELIVEHTWVLSHPEKGKLGVYP